MKFLVSARGGSAFRKLTAPLRWAALAVLALALTACLTNQQPKITSHTSTTALRGENSLPVDVVEYTWTFFNYGHHLRLTGRVRNNSAEAYQAVALRTALLDETGAAVVQGTANVYPTYLRPGGEGSFELVVMVVSPGRNLAAGHLVTTAVTSGP